MTFGEEVDTSDYDSDFFDPTFNNSPYGSDKDGYYGYGRDEAYNYASDDDCCSLAIFVNPDILSKLPPPSLEHKPNPAKHVSTPSMPSSDLDQAHKDYVQLNENFYGMCAFEPIDVLKAFLDKHRDTINLSFRNYQACQILISRCDPAVRDLVREKLGADWISMCARLAEMIERFCPRVIIFIMDMLPRNIYNPVGNSFAESIKRKIRDTRDITLAKKAFESKLLGPSHNHLSQYLAYFANSFDDELTDYVIDRTEKARAKGCYQRSYPRQPGSVNAGFNTQDLLTIAHTGNTRVFRQVLERWKVHLNNLSGDQLESFVQLCASDKSQVMLDAVVKAKLFNAVPANRISTSVIKTVAKSGHIGATACLVSLACLAKEQVIELLNAGLPTDTLKAIVSNTRDEALKLTDEELMQLSPIVRHDLVHYLSSRARALVDLSMRYDLLEPPKPKTDKKVSKEAADLAHDTSQYAKKSLNDMDKKKHRGRGQSLIRL